MKILLTGGGSGGHFYPVIAIAEMLNSISEQEKIAHMEITFMSDAPYDKNLLLQHGVRFRKTFAGKLRRYFSLLNITDFFKTAIGILKSVWGIFVDFPDVIFSKGGYASFPAVVAARIFGIPLIIHESDAAPGKVNSIAGKFAKRIALSFSEATDYFPKDRVALTGNPIRREFFIPIESGAEEFLNLEENVPVILVMGGSQGSQIINDNLIDILPDLLENYQVVHQCGKANKEGMQERAKLVLDQSQHKTRYHLFDYLDFSHLRMVYGIADLAISRAGGSAIFEFAASSLPSVLIPLANAAQDHQKKNAYAYASTGAADVIEENNLTPHVLGAEIDRLFRESGKLKQMSEAAGRFAKPDAAEKIAREIIALALEHA